MPRESGYIYNGCVLYDRPCVECGECDRCDLDPGKRCDNCMRCVGMPVTNPELSGAGKPGADYRAVRIDGLLTPDEALGGEDADW
ncbi:MAG: hypothetical protein LBS11_02160 [Oscillospiraceae bacterium]|jgi:hypothetical protein|nr:hypothetical protein [Oscillospiraceae bacterium]